MMLMRLQVLHDIAKEGFHFLFTGDLRHPATSPH